MNIRIRGFLPNANTCLRALEICGVAASCNTTWLYQKPTRTTGWTAVTFTFKVAGKINTTVPYIYDVGITASSDANPMPSRAPLPVVGANNPNGRMAGCPTHFVEFNSTDPNSSYPFTLMEFAPTRSGVPNLAVFAPTTRGQISIFKTPQTGGDPDTLSFTVQVNPGD